MAEERNFRRLLLHRREKALRERTERLARHDATFDESAFFPARALAAERVKLTVRRQHIELYVNQYSADLGKRGREAVSNLFKLAEEQKIIPIPKQAIFLPISV